MLLRPAFEGNEVHYATTLKGLSERAEIRNASWIPDCNRNSKGEILYSAIRIALLLIRLRPSVVISTGALPGLLALIIGKRLGARTIWVDSVANAEEMSLAGQRARSFADLWMSQWPEVAAASGAEYAGSVL
jgi:UDP-N-acetylglucosamine:LPS N-acetylglucosamine transferase